jgi:hypothetical protein
VTPVKGLIKVVDSADVVCEAIPVAAVCDAKLVGDRGCPMEGVKD